jgi:putative phosphoribosyl transferase
LQSNTAIEPSNIDQKRADSVQICGINGGIPSRVAGRAHPKANSSQDGRMPTNCKGQAMARQKTTRQLRDPSQDQLRDPSRDQWRDRRAAGQELSEKCLALGQGFLRSNTMVVALPRGGVPVGLEVANALQVPLSTWSVRKLARAQAPEVAVGAIAAGGVELWDSSREDIPIQERRQILAKEWQELKHRQQYFADGPIERLNGKNLIVVDDGIATGMTAAAALHSLRAASPNKLILAIPVVDQKLIAPLQDLCDQLIALKVVSNLNAVGEYFENFDQLHDADVINLLGEAKLSIHSKV